MFDDIPDDSQLVCLLGDPDCGPVMAVGDSDLLIVRPRLVPMKFVIPWMVFVGVVITCMMFFMPRPPIQPGEFWLMLFALWFLCLPGFLLLLLFLNRSFAKKGDCFKADTIQRTLELCPVGRTFKSSEIIALILLTRWYQYGQTTWNKTHQTCVLVHAPDNKVALYLVVRELAENVPIFKSSKWADRLANIFQTTVRRIELSKSESKALNDC